MKPSRFIQVLGPGLLYAGAAVGVSHLVQSTRAGAEFGFALAGVLILANVIKYPFFEFAPRYATGTGKNLVDGYAEMGSWALWLFAILTLATMFTVVGYWSEFYPKKQVLITPQCAERPSHMKSTTIHSFL